MRWNYKQLVGIIILIVGFLGVFLGRHYMNDIDHAKSKVGFFSRYFSSSASEKAAARGVLRQARRYDSQVQVLLYGGILLMIAGGSILYLSWEKKKK